MKTKQSKEINWKKRISDPTGFDRITIKGLGGNDTVHLNERALNPHGASLSFSGGEGKDKVVIKQINKITGSSGLLFGSNAKTLTLTA